MSPRHTPKSCQQASLEDLLFPSVLGTELPSAIEQLMCRIYRVQLVREGELAFGGRTTISCPDDAAGILEGYFRDKDREHFVILMLNTKNAVTGFHTVSIGTLDASLVHPREVFKPAILANAASVIAAHNHPSGDPEPSLQDRTLTQRLVTSGELLGIPMLDHIIIGAPGLFRSLKQSGVM